MDDLQRQLLLEEIAHYREALYYIAEGADRPQHVAVRALDFHANPLALHD
jgi:hypothetical protein